MSRRRAVLPALAPAALAAMLLVAVLPGGAAGQGVPESFWGMPGGGRAPRAGDYPVEAMQADLLWVGFYYGRIDGEEGEDTRTAAGRFQESLGAAATGTLSPLQADTLRRRAARARERADFREVKEEWTGVAVSLPMGYLGPPTLERLEDEVTTVRFPARGSADLEVLVSRFEAFGGKVRPIYDSLLKAYREKEEYAEVNGTISGNFFLLSYIVGDTFSSQVFEVGRSETRALTLRYPVSRQNIFAPVRMAMLAGLSHFDGPGLSPAERKRRVSRREYPGYQEGPEWYRTTIATGSGSLVTWQGHVLTNFHVVDGCDSLTVNGNPALLLGVDIVNDLALLRAERFANRSPVRFRALDARLGEEVIVMGYPVFSVSRALNLTTGVVSARAGLYGDRRNIQVTAPIQPGNSGGPVLDLAGQQIAVVVSKAAGSLREKVDNMGWVIRGDIAIDFMRDLGVEPLLAGAEPAPDARVPDVATRARAYTLRVECHAPR
ncbi:serine protease [Oceanicella sp. SM1341]|uniref:serine protease n=1 Tax=Oceanicella sp. SM1341 TaxID=1548889 RepID=UPI000E5414FE|nr:serine protease [Oceanicella sp. SM1341]